MVTSHWCFNMSLDREKLDLALCTSYTITCFHLVTLNKSDIQWACVPQFQIQHTLMLILLIEICVSQASVCCTNNIFFLYVTLKSSPRNQTLCDGKGAWKWYITNTYRHLAVMTEGQNFLVTDGFQTWSSNILLDLNDDLFMLKCDI